MCTALVCIVQCFIPVRLGHWQSQTSSICSRMTGQWFIQICNVRPQDIVTTRSNKLLAWFGIEDLDLILKERRLRWYGHVECSNGAVKTAFYIQVKKSVVLGGPRWHGSSGQTGIAETGSSRLLTLMIDIRGDLGWDLPCVQLASSLVVGPLMWMLQHVNKKSDCDYDIWLSVYLAIIVFIYYFGTFHTIFVSFYFRLFQYFYDISYWNIHQI